MDGKVNDGSTYLTRIHHRESPLRVKQGDSGVAPMWSRRDGIELKFDAYQV